MRLTLRTLLAYLDDTLEPAQAKLIGQKIAESSTAQELIARIKDVVRRRRLTTPAETAPGSKGDANTIAEYIDSTLPPEKLAEVEEQCLGSDVHLAEIAACHQILTVILSKPALVPPTARQRMYGLIHGREAIPYRKTSRMVSVDGTASESAAQANEADEALLLGLPLYRSEGPWYRRLLPLGVVLVLLLLLAAAIWQAMPSTPRSRRAVSEAVVAEESPTKAPAEVVAAKAEKPPAPEKAKTAASSVAKEQPGGDSSVASFKGGVGVTAPVSRPPAENKAATPVGASESSPSTQVPSTKPATEQPPVAEERSPTGRYVVSGPNPSILLARASAGEPWRRQVRNNQVHTGDTLVSLPGYRSEIRLDNGIHLTLWGDIPDNNSPVIMLESKVILHAASDVDVDITLERGRIAIANYRPKGAARGRLRFNNQTWEATLLESGTQVALELVGFPDVGFNKNPSKEEGPIAGLGFYALQGQANLKVGYSTHFMREPRGPALFIWNNLVGASAAPQTLSPTQMPNWARRVPVVSKELEGLRRAQDDMANRMTPNTPIDVVLQEMLQVRDSSSRVMAVYCAGAVDDLGDLTDALGSEKRPQERAAAIATLRQWLGHAAENDMKLYSVLASKNRPGHADIIMELLHPYSARQKQQPETYEALIAFLKHDQLAIRELAYSHLAALVPEGRKDIPYDPDGTPQQLNAAYELWKKLIPTGKLPPRPSAPGAGSRQGGNRR
jgi:hypothetical protein